MSKFGMYLMLLGIGAMVAPHGDAEAGNIILVIGAVFALFGFIWETLEDK